MESVRTAYRGTTATGYDERRFRTAQGRAFDELEAEQLLQAAADLPAGARVLEVGCGTGRFLERLAGRGFRCTGLDPSQDMLDVAAAKFPEGAVRWVQGAGASLPFEAAAFDFVYAIRVLNQTESEAYAYRVLDEMVRVTAPGGRILVEFANRLRPPTAGDRSVRLSTSAVLRWAEAKPSLRVMGEGGVLLFSQSVLEHVPTPFVSAWTKMERRLARQYPRWAARCYLQFRKTEEA